MSGKAGPGQRQSDAPRPITPVGIAAELLTRVQQQLADDGTASAEAQEDLRRAATLIAGLEDYTGRCTTPASADLQHLEADTNDREWDTGGTTGAAVEREMLSGHVEGQLLRLLVGIAGAESALDVGLFTGYSSLAMAEGLPETGTVVACELDPDVADFARQRIERSSHGHKVHIRVGPAAQTLQSLAEEGRTFDVAFIDADKEGYVEYLALLLDGGLVRPGGLVLADNTLLQGQPYAAGTPGGAGEAIATFNQAVVAEPRVEQVLIPLRDGVTMMRVVGA